MKKLENKIIRGVYVLETKKLSFAFVWKLLAAVVSGGLAFLMTQVLLEFMYEGRTFDVFEIFSDDAEVIRKYIGDISGVIFQETPKGLLLAIIISSFLFIFIILTFILRFGKMKHKLSALLHYWQHDRHL